MYMDAAWGSSEPGPSLPTYLLYLGMGPCILVASTLAMFWPRCAPQPLSRFSASMMKDAITNWLPAKALGLTDNRP